MAKSEISELQLTVRLIEGNQEIATLEKCFGFVEIMDEEEVETATKTIDDTISEFQEEIERKALELGRTFRKDALEQAMFLLILLVVNRSQPDVTLDIPVEKQVVEEEKVGNSNSDT